MTKETMNIHQALSELKTIDARIEKAIYGLNPVIAAKHSAKKINGVSIDDFKANIKSDYQKINDLIARRDAMKRAVVMSNATTKVTICGTEYTVASAIDAKNHGMEMRDMLLRKMTSAWANAQSDMLRNDGEALEKKAEKYILDVIAAQPKDSKMAADSEAMKAMRQAYIDNNTYDLIDPLNVSKIIAELDEQINKFNTEVDAVLSTSNAITVIEFEY